MNLKNSLFVLFAVAASFLALSSGALPSGAFAGEWRSLSPMETGRSHLAAVAVGREISAAGGSGLLGPRNAFEVYDVTYDHWRALPAMPEAREQFAMVAVGGEIHVVGGFGASGRGEPSNSLWTYNTSISSWRQGVEMPDARARHAAASVVGDVYVFGGVNAEGITTNQVMVLSGNGSGWRTLTTPMPHARTDSAAVPLNNKIYVIGGRDESGVASSRVDVFDTATATWSQAASLPNARSGHTAGVVDGRIHVTGGLGAGILRTFTDHFVYTADANSWRTVEQLPTARHSLASAVVENQWFVVGGGSGSGFFTEFTEADIVEVYVSSASE